jgi:hypothetical protein
MLRNGITPVMLKKRVAKKIVVMTEAYFLPSFSPRISMEIEFRQKSRPISRRLWKRPGTSLARRAPMTKIARIAMAATKRTRMIRLISNGVPSKKMAGGKKSAIVGPWKPPSPSSAASGRIVARLNRAVSRGRVRRVPHQCGHQHGAGPSWMAKA